MTGCTAWSYLKIYKAGKIIYLEGDISTTTGVAAGNMSSKLGTVNASYTPFANFFLSTQGILGGKYHPATLYITTNGEVYMINSSALTGNTVFYSIFSGMYIQH